MRSWHRWKAKPGFNDDWSNGFRVGEFAGASHFVRRKARAAFEKFYWGSDGQRGTFENEKVAVTQWQIEKWAQHFELNLFTGRTRQNFSIHV